MEVEAVLFDIDGVLVTSWAPLPGAADAVNAVRAAGLGVRFLTNSTSKSAGEIAAALAGAGIEVDPTELLTAGVATADHLRRRHPGARCLVLNDGSLEDLAGLDLLVPGEGPAEVVVIGSGGDSFSWAAMNEALRAVLDGADLVAMHGSPMWRTAAGMCLDGAAYAAMLAEAAGVEPTVIGKPAPAMFRTALDDLGVGAPATVMVGDDIRSDVLAAQDVGIGGVQVRTGKFRAELLEGLPAEPAAVIDSVADLPALLGIAGTGVP